MKYTLVGDSQLTGRVGIADYDAVLGNFGNTGASWTDGNFNYSGTVGLTDYAAILNNFGDSAF